MAGIELKICMGTMCYVMGGAELRAFVELLPENIRNHVSVSYSPCLGACDKVGQPPYVEINGRIISRVSKADLIQLLKEEIKNVVR